jgi:hypothetical protein
MILRIVDRKTDAIMYQGQPKTTEDFAELNSRYPLEKYKRFVGAVDATTR